MGRRACEEGLGHTRRYHSGGTGRQGTQGRWDIRKLRKVLA